MKFRPSAMAVFAAIDSALDCLIEKMIVCVSSRQP